MAPEGITNSSYTVCYEYNGTGDRSLAVCVTPNGLSGMEEHHTVEGQPGQSAQLTVTRHALGARGTDASYVSANGAEETSAYPLYDGHGNMVGEVARAASSPWFTLGSQRKYDAWGQVRSGSGPDQGYCATLGHRRDAESGLLYMRARYYEPWTGRFISEDPAMDGANWYVYCGNDPVNETDSTGLSRDSVTEAMRVAFLRALAGNWSDLVDLMEILVTAFGGPAIDGRAAMIIETLESVSTPKGGLKKIANWKEGQGMMDEIIKHIHKALTHHEYAVEKHLGDMRNWLNQLYKLNRRR